MRTYIDLFLTFAKVGVTTFGGGYAMLPILEREVVENKKWATTGELSDYFAIGQCTPGIIAVNTATFIGSKQKGILGAVFATLGLACPGIIIISLLAAGLSHFNEMSAVGHAFNGLRAAICVLIINAVIKLGKSSLKDAFSLFLFLAVLAAALFFKISPALLVLSCGFLGLLVGLFKGRRSASSSSGVSGESGAENAAQEAKKL